MSVCALRIHFDKDSPSYRPGETVSGRVVVEVHKDCQCADLNLSHQWRTHGKGNRTSGKQYSFSIAKSQNWRSGRIYEYPFEFKAPPGPPTYHGHYLNVDWYLKATAEISWGATRLMAGHIRHPNYETEFLLLPRKGPLTVTSQEAIKDRSQLYVIVGAIIVVVGIVMLLYQFGQDGTRLGALAWELILMGIGVFVLVRNLGNTLSQLRLGTVKAYISTGKDVHHIQGTIRFRPRRSMILERISVYLNVGEAVTEGYRSNAKTHTHNIFSEKADDVASGKLVPNQPFETTLLLEIPDNLPSTFNEDDNKINWEVKFEVVPRDWHSWSHKQVIKVCR